MAPPPIPQRIPPLTWRQPAFLWTPIALAAAIGWPALLFYNDYGLQQLVVIAGAIVFAFALLTLGVSWMLRRPPRTRRTAVMHVIVAGAIIACVSPLALTQIHGATDLTLPMAMTMLPLAIVAGLPAALISAIAFTWLALKRQSPAEPHDLVDSGLMHSDVQPFR